MYSLPTGLTSVSCRHMVVTGLPVVTGETKRTKASRWVRNDLRVEKGIDMKAKGEILLAKRE